MWGGFGDFTQKLGGRCTTEVALVQFHLLFNDKGNKQKAYWGGRGRQKTEPDELNEAKNVCRSRMEKLKSKHF